jgi:hypothetical protein
MKNIFFTALVLFLNILVASGQASFKVEPNPAAVTAPQTEFDVPAKSFIFNLTNQKLNIKWERTEVSVPAGLMTQVCDLNVCWAASVSTKDVEIEAKDTANMDVHFVNLNALKTSAIVHLKITNLDKPAETVTAIYLFNPSSGVKDLPPATVRLFPNPLVDFFTLENAGAVHALSLLSVDGRRLARWDALPEQTYSLRDQAAGKYFLVLEEKNGQVFQVLDLVKN